MYNRDKKSAQKAGIPFTCIGTYGSLEGINAYKGMDIVLFGMLHQPPVVYSLFAYAIGLKVGIADGFQKTASLVTRNNFQFQYHTISDDQLLQEIQFYFLEEALIQAVGRARLVEHDCEVTVYTNLPLPQAEIID